MNIPFGASRKRRPAVALDPAGEDGPALSLGRAHEATGPAAVVFAAMLAGRLTGPVIWIRPAFARSRLAPEGLAAFFAPSRLVVANSPRPVDVLWAAEEALRSGAAPLVVAETTAPPALTPLRRLQLAAEAGGEAARTLGAGRGAPICLLLPPEAGTAGAVESRWRCDPLPAWAGSSPDAPARPRWRFARVYGKSGPPTAWEAGGGVLTRAVA